MPKLVEAGFEADLTGDNRVTRSGVHVSFGDKQLKLRHLNPQKEVAARWSADHWSFSYNFKTKDVDFEYKTQVKPGELYIRQRIPNTQWELFPTPEFKLCVTPSRFKKFEHRLAISYDLLGSRGRIEQALDYNKRFTFKLNADTAAGGYCAAIANIGRPWAKSVGVDYSRKRGPVLSYHAEPSKQLVFDSAVCLERSELWASLQVAPSKDSRFKLTAEATASTSSLMKPALRLGARYTV